MRTMVVVAGIVGLSLAVAGAPALGQIGAKPKADDRVRRALQDTDLKFSVDKDGDFRLDFTLVGGRTHVVFIASKTAQWGNMEIREVFALGYRSDTRLSRDNYEDMLKDNGRRKSGAWELHEKDGRYVAVFSVKVAADCSGESLKTVANGVAATADEMEKKLTDTDDL